MSIFMNEEIILKVKNLKTYFYTEKGEGRAVDNISFNLKKEKILAIVGESGCGKSITALSILRLIEPPGEIIGGEILFNNINLLKLTKEEIRKIRGNKIGIIFQDPMMSLNPVFKAGEQIVETILTHKDMTKKEAKDLSLSLFEKVKLPDPEKVFNSYPHELSGGMRQRVMIAIALCCNPDILIADEPTTALDVTTQERVLDLIKELQSNSELSVLFITHDFRIVNKIADEVIVMYGGKIVEYRDKNSILKNPLHPYTKGLINSIPPVDKKIEKLPVIEGEVPDIFKNIKGCKFADRCKLSKEICFKKFPEKIKVDSNYSVFCWNYS